MNNEQQTWVLKQPIEAEYRPIDEDCDYERMFVEAFGEAISLDKFNNLFQPLDVSGLTRQVEETLNEYIYMMVWESVQHSLEEKDWAEGMVEHSKKVIAEKVVGLLLNQERETK